MEPDGPATATPSRTEGALVRASRLLGSTPPETRMWRARRWAATMLVCGIGMIVTSALAVFGEPDGTPPPLLWYWAVGGAGSALLGTSDLLVGRPGARWAVLALRVVAHLCFVSVPLTWAWQAANGNGWATLALALSFGTALVAYAVKKADARHQS